MLLKRAAIIPYFIENNQIEMLFMRPTDERFGGKKIQVAKGIIEIGENVLATALREGYEELGLLVDNILDIDIIEKNWCKYTIVFIVQVKNKNNFAVPGYETKEIKWMTPDDFQIVGRKFQKNTVTNAKNHIINLKL